MPQVIWTTKVYFHVILQQNTRTIHLQYKSTGQGFIAQQHSVICSSNTTGCQQDSVPVAKAWKSVTHCSFFSRTVTSYPPQYLTQSNTDLWMNMRLCAKSTIFFWNKYFHVAPRLFTMPLISVCFIIHISAYLSIIHMMKVLIAYQRSFFLLSDLSTFYIWQEVYQQQFKHYENSVMCNFSHLQQYMVLQYINICFPHWSLLGSLKPHNLYSSILI